ncbi:hypothetical protein HDU87_005282 [Geranomyces variabilis]|uniref:GmrSD restriction endonucleases N-terminal domain-containing protein n=1 Tax=Geranomyces variabilis TaxID=109894 RepID=A0AAD5XRC5_9FUNG|nr:hypothetical protein HDU87_005282 [Geranomyces variabilis]
MVPNLKEEVLWDEDLPDSQQQLVEETGRRRTRAQTHRAVAPPESDYDDDGDSDDDEEFDEEAAESQRRANAALSAPQPFTVPFRDLTQHIGSGVIDLDAPYQRDVVWNAAKQGHLIDSLVKHYYVPPVIFSIHEGPGGIDIRVAIDGKQRLTSIFRFMRGEIPQIDSVTGQRVWFSSHSKRKTTAKVRVMTSQEQKEFGEMQMICVQYRGISFEQEQEIFRRVQLGVALSISERLFAKGGPLADFIRELMIKHEDLLGRIETRRKLGFTILGQIFIIVCFSPPRCPTGLHVDKEISKKDRVSERHRNLVSEVLNIFEDVANNMPELFTQPVRMAPVEFIMCAYMISVREADHFRILGAKMAEMRKATRKQFLDIRTNQRVFDFMKKYIEKL